MYPRLDFVCLLPDFFCVCFASGDGGKWSLLRFSTIILPLEKNWLPPSRRRQNSWKSSYYLLMNSRRKQTVSYLRFLRNGVQWWIPSVAFNTSLAAFHSVRAAEERRNRGGCQGLHFRHGDGAGFFQAEGAPRAQAVKRQELKQYYDRGAELFQTILICTM